MSDQISTKRIAIISFVCFFIGFVILMLLRNSELTLPISSLFWAFIIVVAFFVATFLAIVVLIDFVTAFFKRIKENKKMNNDLNNDVLDEHLL